MKYAQVLSGLLVFICVSLYAEKAVPTDAVSDTISKTGSPSIKYSYKKGVPIRIQMPGLFLQADSGSLEHAIEISVTILQSKDVSGMPSHMDNVSQYGNGVRLLPNGKHFAEDSPALVTLAYDPSRIPMGYTPNDIYTYYSEASSVWHRLERVSIDSIGHTITSYTTHFTDFANAIIKVPEMPDSKAFVPTEMTKLPDPDPLTGIPMIAVPEANNMGTAEVSYPIQLPPGRHGLQPDLDLHYSSAGGNGLLGVGWSVAQPAVTIDTRWGVPRYNLKYETEAYLINGEPFLLHDDNDEPLPLPHMASSFEPRRAIATRFYARDQRNQSKAVRHGQTPDHYWWSVTTTDGVTYYYGYNPYTHTLDENSVLRTKEGYIGYWALTYVVDRYDNYMRYVNDKYSDNEIVIQSIEYTGNYHRDLQPYYRVVFTYKPRSDKQLDARLGMLRKQNHLLCQLYVLMGEETVPITTYRLYYQSGEYSLYKSRLKSIAKIDGGIAYLQECSLPIANTRLELSDEHWIAEEDILYEEITEEGINEEQKPGSLTEFEYADAFSPGALFNNAKTVISNPTNFSASRTEGWNIGGTATIGVGFNPAMTIFSAGANYSYSRSQGGVETMMIDLNGDALLDRLQVSNNSVLYQRQQNNGYFASPVPISGLDRLSREVSSSHTFGLQLDFAANLSYNPVISDSYTDIYFADINGDGLPDLITPEGVRINLLNSNNIPTFYPIADNEEGIEVHGNNCSKSITFDGHVDERLMCSLTYQCIDTLLLSVLRPSDDGEAEFIEHPIVPDSPEHEDEGSLEPHGWSPLPIEEVERETKAMAKSRDSIIALSYAGMNIEPKSSISSQSSSDRLASSPNWATILNGYYQGEDYTFRLVHDTIFVFHKKYDCVQSSDEPNIDIVRVWVSDREGTIRINSKASLIPDTTFSRTQARNADGVRLRIQWNRNARQAGNRIVADTMQMIYDHITEADDYSSDSVFYNLSVQEGDILFFRLSARNNRRFDNVNWEQTILSVSGDTLFNSARDYLCSGDQSFVAPAAGTARITLSCTNSDSKPVRISAKRDNTQILNRTIPAHTSLDTVFYSSVADSSHISFFADSLSSEPMWSKVHIIPSVDYWGSLEIDTAGTGTTLHDTLHYNPDVHLHPSSFYPLDTCLYRKLFGPLHKGWGWFAYNDVNGDSLIPLQILYNDEYIMADSVLMNENAYRNDNAYAVLHNSSLSIQERMEKADSCFSAVPTYNPLSKTKHWVAMHSDYPNNQYVAFGNTGTIGQRLHSVSRQLQAVADASIVRGTIAEYDSPIPTLHDDMQRITTIRKSTHAIQHSLSYGLSTPIGIGISENVSFGSYDVTSDYTDLNGDGFPDFVGKSAIQYSNPWGGIGSLEGQLPASFSNSNSSAGLGFSASRPRPEHIPANGVTNSKMAFGGFGGGLSGQVGTDETHTTFFDINADGLPDMVDAEHHCVKYNLGYSFTGEWDTIASLSIAASSHADASFSLSGDAHFEQIWDVIEKAGVIEDYSLAQYSISGGFSTSTSRNHSDIRLIDINGDGYPDLLSENNMGNIYVRYYDGTSFGASQMLNAQNMQTSNTANIGFNLGVTGGIDLVAIPIKFCIGAQTSPWNVSSSYGNTEFMDVNGDGFVDQVISGNTLQVRYNKNGSRPINLLTKITNPTGQTISISYALSQPSVKHRTRTWNMVQVDDTITPLSDASSIHSYDFSYSDPFYDNYERTDYGFAHVYTGDNHMYSLEEEYENQCYIKRGEKKSDLLFDESHHRIIGHRHETTYYTSSSVPQTDVCDDIELHAGAEGYWTDYYETELIPQITTREEKFYDAHHNLIQHIDYGDVNIADDDWSQTISYKANTSYNMISLPVFERIEDGLGRVLRQSRCNYDSYGKPFQIIQDNIEGNISAVTVLRYDVYGNIDTIRNPRNENNEWSWRRFQYDNDTKTHVTHVYNEFQEHHYYDCDLRFGKRTYSQDPAGNEMYWRYDRMGRLIDIVAPNEVAASLPFSVHYIYRQPYHDLAQNALQQLLYPHVTKVSADASLASVDVTIYDARGQSRQCKSWRNVNDHYEWVTDGWCKRDEWYRPIETSYPFITDISSKPLWKPDSTSALPFKTLYRYDALNRLTYCWHPDTTETYTTYHFAIDVNMKKRLLTEHTDENGIIRQVLQSPQGWTIETKNLMDNSITQYEYNPIGELTGVYDADGYSTKYDYDQFGNRICRFHSDAGYTRWNYAPNGSLVSVKTSRMSGSGDSIHYTYCFNKLTDISYPHTPYNNVHYQYDIAGRMAYYEDGSGSTRLYYDRMGNVSMSHRRIVVPTDSKVYTFRTRFTYDSFGRIRNIIYPDGDNVTYRYYPSGELEEVTRSPLSGTTTPVVEKLGYDEQGHIIHRTFGNNVLTDHQYEPLRNRLTRMRTTSPYCILQKVDYTYDRVNNITHIAQNEPNCHNMGGAYDIEYKYDAQNRLTEATSATNPFNYIFQANYSHAGRFGHGFCSNTNDEANNLYGYDDQRTTHQPRVIFDQKNEIHTQLFWDANGNLSRIMDCSTEYVRFHDWDDENRLSMVVDTANAGYYSYDANGDRVYKLTGTSSMTHITNERSDASVLLNDAVLYPNPYITITSTGYTKHYYMNGERLATSIGGGGFCSMSQDAISDPVTQHEEYLSGGRVKIYEDTAYPFEYPYEQEPGLTRNVNINDTFHNELQYKCPMQHLSHLSVDYDSDILWRVMTDNCNAYDAEKDIYYRHSDHLGSASWVTDFDGAPIQYIHYLPYGQILVNQHMVGYDERYKFTGKERDTETGYDYFGARYYSPSLIHWTSVDPLVDDNPHISPYAYCNWNPLKFVDPDGKLPDAIWDVFWITYDIASVVYDYSSGDNQQVALDVASLSADVGALFIPGLPALAGVGRLASRLGTHVDDAAKVASVSGKGISATRNTYREALKKATGKSGKGYEAHHTLPQKHREKFEKLGINIDEPRYVVWRKAENHHAGNTEHGDAWDEFFEKNPQYTKEQVLQQRNVIEQQVWPDAPAGETPTN